MHNPPLDTPADEPIESFAVRFEGSEHEYRRIWSTNLILTVLTFGLYTPFARRRRLRYFLGLTEVAGSPLEFTGPWRSMLKGFLAVAGLYLAYSIASHSGQAGAVQALLAGIALLTPWAWGSRWRFRLAHTRWRGIRLRFTATWAETYFALWPLLPLAALLLFTPLLAQHLVESSQAGAMRAAPLVATFAGGLALLLLLAARLDCNGTRLLVQRTQVGHLPCHWRPGAPRYAEFLRAWLQAAALFAVLQFAAFLVIFVGAGLAGLALTGRAAPGTLGVIAAMASLPVAWASWAAAAGLRRARIFRLTWDHLAISSVARVRCDLEAGPYVRLCVRNAMLCAVTLGLWSPWAAVRQYRMRVESVTLHVKGGLDHITGDLERQQEALGDAVAELMGLELVG